MLSQAEIQEIARAVVAGLGGSVVSSALPAEIGEWFRKAARYGQFGPYSYHMQLGSDGYVGITSTLNPDGTLHLELTSTSGQPFWRGVLRPVDGSDGGAGTVHPG